MTGILKREERKLILAAVIVTAVFVLFGSLVIRPRLERLSKIKVQFENTWQQIEDIESRLTAGRTLEQYISALYKAAQALDQAFPAREDETIGKISDIARQSNIEILAVKSQLKKQYFDKDQKEVTVHDKKCYTVAVAMQLRGSYKDLVSYLETLKGSLPAYFTVEKMDMQKSGPTPPLLDVSFEINLYLLSS